MAASVRVSRPRDASPSLPPPPGKGFHATDRSERTEAGRGCEQQGGQTGALQTVGSRTHTSVHLCRPCTKLNGEGEQVPEVHSFAIVCSKISHFLGAFAQGPTSNKNNMVVPLQRKNSGLAATSVQAPRSTRNKAVPTSKYWTDDTACDQEVLVTRDQRGQATNDRAEHATHSKGHSGHVLDGTEERTPAASTHKMHRTAGEGDKKSEDK